MKANLTLGIFSTLWLLVSSIDVPDIKKPEVDVSGKLPTRKGKDDKNSISDALKLNEVQVLGTHNSYHIHPNETLMELYSVLETYK
eukprot:Awhi_evm1s14407